MRQQLQIGKFPVFFSISRFVKINFIWKKTVPEGCSYHSFYYKTVLGVYFQLAEQKRLILAIFLNTQEHRDTNIRMPWYSWNTSELLRFVLIL